MCERKQIDGGGSRQEPVQRSAIGDDCFVSGSSRSRVASPQTSQALSNIPLRPLHILPPQAYLERSIRPIASTDIEYGC